MAELEKFVAQISQKYPEFQLGFFYPSIDSTNQEAWRRAEAEPNLRALFVARRQTAGRGRRGRTWESPEGKGLYFSLLFHPRLPIPESLLITLAAGWALGKALKKMGAAPIVVKWPNDTLLQGKKVAGILCEMKSLGDKVNFVVVGVGVNLSQSPEDFSPEVAEKAGSLEKLTGKNWSEEEVLKNFLDSFLPEIKNLESGAKAELISRWEKESGLIGRKISARQDHQTQTGIATGLTPEGYLKLKLEDGSELHLVDEETTLL